MIPIIEVSRPKLNLTTSNYNNDWLDFLDNGTCIMNTIKNMQLSFPEVSKDMIEYSDEQWVLINGETTGSEVSVKHPEMDFNYDIESPIISARKKFTVNLIIEKIEKGRPSICDEVEL